ncbi:hypothetical protein HID58_075322 [Brassica napus]|uniref:Uncharacterized protein n=1 Tax=Brassica napus TaxID=3708 RepID=A0ABQ7YJC5_BRANA|nr:hypothetical protein HID58_075322 [Brassica napus]
MKSLLLFLYSTYPVIKPAVFIAIKRRNPPRLPSSLLASIVRPVGKSDNERLRVPRLRGGLVYHIHGHSGDMIRIRILSRRVKRGFDLRMLARRRINGKLFEYTLYTFLLPVLLSNICVASVNNGGFPKPTVMEMGKKLAKRIRKQRALHCPECIFHQYHIFKAKKGEDEHGDLKPASIAEGGNCSKPYFPNLKTLVWERMVYLIIKELSPSADKVCSFIVTSSLISDMNSKIDMYLANVAKPKLRLCCKMISFINISFYIDIYVEKEKKKEKLTRIKDVKGL